VDNAAHLHLLVNHFPIIASVLAVPMLLLTFVFRKERGLLLASVLLLVVTAGAGWISIETGEKAETMFEDHPNKEWYEPFEEEEATVTEHEQRAERATWWFALPTAALGIALLVVAHLRSRDDPLPRWWILLLLVAAVLTALGMGYVGNAGGVIMHREIRGDSLDTTVKPKEVEAKPPAAPDGK
jgi:uncharacterized membrane protein